MQVFSGFNFKTQKYNNNPGKQYRNNSFRTESHGPFILLLNNKTNKPRKCYYKRINKKGKLWKSTFAPYAITSMIPNWEILKME